MGGLKFRLLFLFSLFLALILIPGLSANQTAGVGNLPPRITDILASNSIIGRDTVFIVVITDPNGASDICAGGYCNITCAYAELFSSQGRETLDCSEGTCTVFSQLTAADASPIWDPKSSRLSARVTFGARAHSGRWSCVISVADGSLATDRRDYSLFVSPPSFLSALIDNADTIVFSYLVPIGFFLALFLAIFGFLKSRYNSVDWKDLAEGFIAAKANILHLSDRISVAPDSKTAQASRGMLMAARMSFSGADYGDAIWLCRQGLAELGEKPEKVHVPTRLLTLWESAELLISGMRRAVLRRRE
jgi:hypothetical protein